MRRKWPIARGYKVRIFHLLITRDNDFLHAGCKAIPLRQRLFEAFMHSIFQENGEFNFIAVQKFVVGTLFWYFRPIGLGWKVKNVFVYKTSLVFIENIKFFIINRSFFDISFRCFF